MRCTIQTGPTDILAHLEEEIGGQLTECSNEDEN